MQNESADHVDEQSRRNSWREAFEAWEDIVREDVRRILEQDEPLRVELARAFAVCARAAPNSGRPVSGSNSSTAGALLNSLFQLSREDLI